jgi:hypothetical protein
MILGTNISRKRYLVFVAALAAIFCILAPPLPQDPKYHDLAGANVWQTTLTNIPFVLIGVWGLTRARNEAERLFAWGVLLTGFGSAYYHLAPDDHRLVWDRLPMTIAFMALFGHVLDVWAGLRNWTWALIGLGIGSIVWWGFFDDLRLYGIVQFGPALVLVPAILTDPEIRGVWPGLLAYVAAKVFERLDDPIYNAIGFSGHALKHLAAALAAYWILQWIFTSSGTASPSLTQTRGETSIGR